MPWRSSGQPSWKDARHLLSVLKKQEVSQFTKETRQAQTQRPGPPTGGFCQGVEALTGQVLTRFTGFYLPPFLQSPLSGPTEQDWAK